MVKDVYLLVMHDPNWEAVAAALVALTRTPGRCESMPLAFPGPDAAVLAAGPFAPAPPGPGVCGRSELLAMLAQDLPGPGQDPLWPGDNLVAPPKDPVTLPYLPHGT